MDFVGSLEKRAVALLRNQWVGTSMIATMAALGVYLYVYVAGYSLLPDFAVYLRAGEAMNEGRNIYARPYEVEFVPGEFFRLQYLYPPLVAYLLSKVAWLGEPTLRFVWSGLSFLAIVGSVLQVAKLLGYSWWREVSLRVRILFVSFFFLCFEPLASGIGHGQVTAVVLWLLTSFTLESVRRHERRAGLALAFAIHIKMTPVLLLLAPILFRRWRTVGWCAMGVVAIATLPVVELGSFDHITHFLASISATSNNPVLRGAEYNFAVDRVLLLPLGLFGQELPRRLVMLSLLGVFAGCLAGMRRRNEQDFLEMVGVLIVVMVLVSPIIWFHHFAWILPSLAIATMRPAPTFDLRLKNLTISLGILFAVSKILLLHTVVIHEAAILTHVSALVPTCLLLWLSLYLFFAPAQEEQM
ncbi:MAG: hypothetical protein RIS36_1877 [Pseudomonadota bacterium]